MGNGSKQERGEDKLTSMGDGTTPTATNEQTTTASIEPDMHREPETDFLPKQGNVLATLEFPQTHSRPIMA